MKISTKLTADKMKNNLLEFAEQVVSGCKDSKQINSAVGAYRVIIAVYNVELKTAKCKGKK